MRLPADCPHRDAPPRIRPIKPKPRSLEDVMENLRHLTRSAHPSGCCRERAGIWLQLRNQEPLCRSIGNEPEAYRFIWRSSFDGEAIVRIGRKQDAVTLRWRQDGLFRSASADLALAAADWERLFDALIAANFWALDGVDETWSGLDGAEWLIEGRRGDIYRAVERWSPQGELHTLGRVFFALAGPPLSGVELY